MKKCIKTGNRNMSQQPACSHRLTWIDDVRGLCMFFVIISHNNAVDVPVFRHIYAPVFLVCFFFVSGYLFKGGGFLESLKKIGRCLLVPYFLLSLVYCFASLTFIRSIRSNTILSYLSDIGYRIIDGSLFWFIACIIVVQIIYSAVFAVFSKKSEWYRIVTAVIGLSSIFFIRRVDGGALPWSIDTALYAVGWFALGHLYKEYSHFVKINENTWGKVISVMLLVCYVAIVLLIDWKTLHIFYDMGNNRFDNPALQLPLSLFGCMAFVLFAQCFKFGKYFNLLGQNTLVTYCFHASIGYAVVRVFFQVCHLTFLQQYQYIYMLIYTFLVGLTMIGLSVLFNKYLPFFVGKKRNKSKLEKS